MIDLTIILPILNQEKSISSVLNSIFSELKKRGVSYELICVENESSDKSWLVLQSLAKNYENLKILKSEKGWGNAIKKGLNFAKGKYICFTVSNGTIDQANILKIYKILMANKGLTMVKIARINRENFNRFFFSRVYNLLVRLMFNINTLDANGSPKIIEKKVLKKIIPLSNDITFDIELLYNMKKNNYYYKEIYIYTQKRRSGISSTNFKSMLEMLFFMLKLKFGFFLFK